MESSSPLFLRPPPPPPLPPVARTQALLCSPTPPLSAFFPFTPPPSSGWVKAAVELRAPLSSFYFFLLLFSPAISSAFPPPTAESPFACPLLGCHLRGPNSPPPLAANQKKLSYVTEVQRDTSSSNTWSHRFHPLPCFLCHAIYSARVEDDASFVRVSLKLANNGKVPLLRKASPEAKTIHACLHETEAVFASRNRISCPNKRLSAILALFSAGGPGKRAKVGRRRKTRA
ncbi:hypothetical protein GW17_00026447 [Ensete ventricosum]|nr:hypothetical protein GW17_00026447 [Ensete ventricosum]